MSLARACFGYVGFKSAPASFGHECLDALQIAAAVRLGAKEFYTSEKPGKPIFRVNEQRIISLHSL